MHFVKKINYVDGYKICLTFNDKKTKIVDIEPYLDKGIFLVLKNPEYFKRVKVIDHTIIWPNEADFCPDVLYEIGKDVKPPIPKKSKTNSSSSEKPVKKTNAKPKR